MSLIEMQLDTVLKYARSRAESGFTRAYGLPVCIINGNAKVAKTSIIRQWLENNNLKNYCENVSKKPVETRIDK